jgi:hypothetical protein
LAAEQFNRGVSVIFNFFRSTARAVKAINQKYATPRMTMTPMVKFSLGLLRFYLLFLVGVLVYKFVLTLHHR